MTSDNGRAPRARQGRRPAAEPPPWGSAAADDEPNQESVARAIVLRLLTGSAKTRAQLADALATKDVPSDVAEHVLDRFEAVGLINDRDYAEMFVRSRQSSKGLAARALGAEMKRKGVPDDIAREVLGGIDADAESQRAFEIAARKVSTSFGATDDQIYRRTMSLLARKGYGSELSSRAVRAAMIERESRNEG